MKNLEILIKRMQAQKECYAGLVELAVELREKLDSGAGDSELAVLMAQREKLVENIKELDESIEQVLSGPGSGDLLESDKASLLQSEMVELANKRAELDKALVEHIQGAKDSILSELGAIGKGRKAIAGYGKISSPVYARFIDFKHK